MEKLYKIIMGFLYTIIGILILLCVVIMCYDKLDFLHFSIKIDKNNGTIIDYDKELSNDDYNTLTFPISAVKAMDLVDRFANPYTNKRYEYGEIREIDGNEYHTIFSSGARPLMVELKTGDIFVYNEEGLITLEEVIPEFVDHREYVGSEGYEEGYKIFHYYLRALIDKGDRKLADSLVDMSYFEENVPEEKEKRYAKIVENTKAYQEGTIVWVESLEQRLASGVIDDFEIGYVVSLTDEYSEKNEKWVDIYVDITCYYELDGRIDTEGEHIRISVKECGDEWKITRISES